LKPPRRKGEEANMILEATIAFILILATTAIIYALGRHVSPKPVQSEGEKASYACGERANFHGLKVNISLYKFLIYFVIFDSAVLLLAFAAFMTTGTNALIVILYLFMLLASSLILLEGGKPNE
jgi:NADH:ubiquinone oxidoreductase subunit 3 (subunit A)